MFHGKSNCTVSFSLCVGQMCLEAPLGQTHPELGHQQMPPPDEDRDPRVSQSSSCSRLGYGSCLVLGSWFSCCGEERLGLLPNSRSFSRESRRAFLSSPLHPSHTHARSHTLAHTLAMLLLQLLLLLLLLLVRSVAPLPFDGSLTRTPRALYVHSTRTHSHTHRQPPPLSLTLHLR